MNTYLFPVYQLSCQLQKLYVFRCEINKPAMNHNFGGICVESVMAVFTIWLSSQSFMWKE